MCSPTEMLMPSSYQGQRSQLWLLPAFEYKKHLGEGECLWLLCAAAVELDLFCLVSPCDPTSVFLICFLITWLFMGKLKQNSLHCPNLDSSLLLLSNCLYCLSPSAVQTGPGHPWCKSADVKKAVTLKGQLSVEYKHLGQQQTKRTLRALTLLLPTRLWNPGCFLGTHCFSHLHVTRDSHRLPSCHNCSSCFHNARDRFISPSLLAWAPLPSHTIPASKTCCWDLPQWLQPVRWAQHEPAEIFLQVFVLFLCIISGLGWLLCQRVGVPESWALNLCLCVKCVCLRNSSCEACAPCILPCYPWL